MTRRVSKSPNVPGKRIFAPFKPGPDGERLAEVVQVRFSDDTWWTRDMMGTILQAYCQGEDIFTNDLNILTAHDGQEYCETCGAPIAWIVCLQAADGQWYPADQFSNDWADAPWPI